MTGFIILIHTLFILSCSGL